MDSSALAEQLRKAEETHYKQSKDLFDREKVSVQFVQQKLQAEQRINQLYQQRLRLIQQINSHETSMFQKGVAQARLVGNQVQSMGTVGQYAQIMSGGRLGAGELITADLIGVTAGTIIGNTPANGMKRLLGIRSKVLMRELRGRILKNTGVSIGEHMRSTGTSPAELADDIVSQGVTSKFGNAYFAGMRSSEKMPFLQGAVKDISGLWRRFGKLGATFSGGALAYQAFFSAQEAWQGGMSLSMSAGDYQRYTNASTRSGIGSFENIYGRYMSARGKALEGDITSRRAFGAYGVGMDSLKNAQQGFDALMSSIARTPQTLISAKGAMDIFGDAANRVVNNVGTFQKMLQSYTSMSTETIQKLVAMKDSFSTTIKEMVNGIGTLVSSLSDLADGFNRIKAHIAALSAFTGTLFGQYESDNWGTPNSNAGPKGAMAKGVFTNDRKEYGLQAAYAAAKKSFHEAMAAYNLPRTGTPNTDIPATAMMTFMPQMEHHINLNRMQRMGFFNAAPIMQVNQATTLSNLVNYAKQTAENTKETANKL